MCTAFCWDSVVSYDCDNVDLGSVLSEITFFSGVFCIWLLVTIESH